MKKLFLLIVLVFLVVGCNNNQQNSSNAEIAVSVSITDISYKPIEEFIEATGTVNSTNEVALNSEMQGLYKVQNNPATGRRFNVGDKVSAGQVIVLLEDEETLNNLRLETRKNDADNAKKEYENQKPIYEKGGITPKEYRSAESTYLNAKFTYDNAVLQLRKMKVVAPFDGVIVEMPYYTPDVKLANNKLVAKIMDYKKLYVEINLPEKRMAEIARNQNARVTHYTLPKDTLRAQISDVAPAINPTTRTFKTSLVIENGGLKLRPGMFIKVDIIISRKAEAIVIPKDIITTNREFKSVYVVENGAAVWKRITTGIENPKEIEVVEGLAVDDKLIIKGYETLRRGSKVKIVQ